MSSDVWLLLGFVFFSLLAIILPVLLRSSHETNLERWAKKENLRILSIKVADREQTPFSCFNTDLSFTFRRVRVSTEDGAEKSGYVCVAGALSPFFSTKVRAKWDGES